MFFWLHFISFPFFFISEMMQSQERGIRIVKVQAEVQQAEDMAPVSEIEITEVTEEAIEEEAIEEEAAAEVIEEAIEEEAAAEVIEEETKKEAKASQKAKVKAKTRAKKKPGKETDENLTFETAGGRQTTLEALAEKIPEDADTAYIRLEENKIYWVKGKETGTIDIW